ncbi:hypothetical protein [Fredinandcohnia sp. 179-A 10B2 NHS]
MKFTVIKEFQDKKTKQIHIVGSEYECDQKRGNELVKLGYLKGEEKQGE